MRKVKLIKLISIALIIVFCSSAFVKKSLFYCSCNTYPSTDTTFDVQFQNCLNNYYPIIEKYEDISDSIKWQNEDASRLDTLVNSEKIKIFTCVKQISNSDKIKNKSVDDVASEFLKNSQHNVRVVDSLKKNMEGLKNLSDTAKDSITINRRDSGNISKEIIKATSNFNKLSKSDKKYDSLLHDFQKDTAKLARRLIAKATKCREANSKLTKILNEINVQTKKIDSIHGLLGATFRNFNADFSISKKSDKEAFDTLFSLIKVFAKYSVEKKNSLLALSALEFSREKIENPFNSALDSLKELLNKDTLPISEYNFYLKDDKNYFSFYVINTDKYNIKIHNNSNKSGMTLKDQYDLLKNKGIAPVALMNGGMFNPDFGPVGLMITDDGSKKSIVAPLNETDGSGNFYMKPNGVFIVDENNSCYVLSSDDFKKNKFWNQPGYKNLKYATQSGPMLISNGKINPQFKKGSSNLNIRNAIGVSSAFPKKVFMAISDDKVNFYDIAFLFKNVFKCENALYLDGFVSKLYLKDSKSKRKSIPDDVQLLGPIISVIKK